MLKPAGRDKRQWRRFATYDFEWHPRTLELRLAGLFDGRDYAAFHTMRQFVDHVLTPQFSGVWLYGHNAGKSDMEFILHEIMSNSGPGQRYRDVEVSAAFSGASAIITKIKRGHKTWTFLDSLWLMRSSLRSIGEAIGIRKGNEDENVEFYETATFSQLRDYNEIDCMILYRAIEEFQLTLWDQGGQLNATLASCAMALFRRRFLSEPISINKRVNEAAREAYFASRVEVIKRKMGEGYYYDINSSFPHAMREEAPGNLRSTGRDIPDSDELFIAQCAVSVPDTYLPVLPVRHKSRVFFPTGKWTGWIMGADFRLLEASGGRIEKVFRVFRFWPNSDMKAFAESVYSLRVRAESEFEKLLFKLLLNSLYGKFAENTVKSGILWNPYRIPICRGPDNPDSPYLDVRMIMPGVWSVDREVEVSHRHVPFASHIVAVARRNIYNYMTSAGDVYYVDTDGFTTTNGTLQSSKELGALKLEYQISGGTFLAPKVYQHRFAPGTQFDKKGNEILQKSRAKGFARKREMSAEDFERLLEGQSLEVEKMASIRELLRSGKTGPEIVKVVKAMRYKTQEKRCRISDTETRPWNVRELK